MRRLDSIDSVVLELDAWMQHYIDWYNQEQDPAFRSKFKACEKARDLLVDQFGEPDL